MSISIHAPAKGATGHGHRSCFDSMGISIHAPAKGATIFNLFLCQHGFISIHAPAKGATCQPQHRRRRHHPFQSTLPRRERLQKAQLSELKKAFQSTLPRRERQTVRQVMTILYIISIHAPAKGATCAICTMSGGCCYFNPRSREGSDVAGFPRRNGRYHFNPRSREGSDSKNHQDYSR